MSIQQQAINTIKKLSLDMITHADSGHAGASLDCAPILYAIYHEAKVCPSAPDWPNRDRIVLSNGHASACLYSILHLMGYSISIDDLRDFRTLGSITPGHPEINTPGIDCSTGALGQGFSNAVGLSLAEKMLSARYNRPKYDIFNHYTYVVCGDGDLMEGLSYESGALAGLWQLNKLIVLYNKNDITIDGDTKLTSAEDVKARFKAQGFDVLECNDNYVNIVLAIRRAKQNNNPTVIVVQTKIAKGTSYEGSTVAHSHPFNTKEVSALCKAWGVEPEPFNVSLDVYKHFKTLQIQGEQEYAKWLHLMKKYSQKYPKETKALSRPEDKSLLKALDVKFSKTNISTIEASHKVLNAMARKDVNLVVGCADLAKSTRINLDGEAYFAAKTPNARNVAFGVRENAMASIINGVALHGLVRGIASTFLAFSDYMRYGIRMSAMMNLPVLYAFTHDSISLGQDGPTHQPVEQLESLRIMPNIMLFRPADANETKYAYMWYATHYTPTIISLSKAESPVIPSCSYKDFCRGGYIVAKEKTHQYNAILIATGSEVDVAIRAKKLLEYKGYSIRVVSMPCRELFEKQDELYKQKVLPKDFGTKVVIEAGTTRSWESMVGRFGHVIGVNTFGESGTPEELYDLFGVSAVNIHNIVIELIKRNKTA